MKFLSSEKLSQHKYKTPEGYLVCTDAILARTGKQTYRRSEVFADSDDDSEIEVDRQSSEVFSPQTLASFENKPITVEHPDENVTPDNYNSLSVGFVRDVHKGTVNGQEVMLGTLVITDADAIAGIENGEHTDLSCGYDCDIVDEENPQQRNIRGNHVALCECGRAGIARIVDSVKLADMKAIESMSYDELTDYRNKLDDLFDKAWDLNVNTKEIDSVRKKVNAQISKMLNIKDSKFRDSYYLVGGYHSKNDRLLKQDIAQAKSKGLKTSVEEIDGSWQLIVEGPKDKVKDIVENYFDGDVSSIGDSKNSNLHYTQRRGVIYVYKGFALLGKFPTKEDARDAGYDLDGAVRFNADYETDDSCSSKDAEFSDIPDRISKDEFNDIYYKLRDKLENKWNYRVSTYGDKFKIEIEKAVGATKGSYGPVGGKWQTIKTIYTTDSKSFTVKYTDNDITYIKKVKANSIVDAIKKTKK